MDWSEIITHRIVKEINPLKIILFGSWARGEGNANSDIDLLVVLSEGVNKREVTIKIRRLLSDLPFPKDIVVTTPIEILEYGNLVGTILKSALEEGKILYEYQ